MGSILRRDVQDGAGSRLWRTIASPEVFKSVNNQILAYVDAKSLKTEDGVITTKAPVSSLTMTFKQPFAA